MIPLFKLAISIGIGVPLSIKIIKTTDDLTKRYNKLIMGNEAKKRLDEMFKECNIDIYFRKVHKTDYGYISFFQTEEKILKLNTLSSRISRIFNGAEVEFKLREEEKMLIITDKTDDTFEKYEFIELSNMQLLCGYSEDKHLILEMNVYPNVLITGLQGQGKTSMLKVMLKNLRNADVVLLNGFDEDFEDFKHIRKVNGEENIYKFINSILENKYKREKPLYLFIDEILTIRNKKTNELILELLTISRHLNVFIVGCALIGLKEQVCYKNYILNKISFRQASDSSYKVVLPIAPEEPLNKREFYLYSDKLYKGYTFTI